jgi:PAS domain S-box-containing protein
LQLFSWFGGLTAGNIVLLIAAWQLRRKFSNVVHLLFILWGGVGIWYWTFAPVYFALTINLNAYQRAWTALAFLWEVPIIGGIIFIALGLRLFRPILEAQETSPAEELRRKYQRVVRYPLIIALLLFMLSVIGYIIGGAQLTFFAALPKFELIKIVASGPIIAIFLSVVYYLTLEEFLDRYRGSLTRSLQHTGSPRRLRWRIAFISISVMLGGVGLLGLLFVNAFQLAAEQRLRAELQRDLTVLDQLVAQGSSIDDTTLKLLVRGPRGHVLVVPSNEMPPVLLSPDTGQLLQHERGIIRDAHHDLKLIAFKNDPQTESRIMTIAYVTDFYAFLRPELTVLYVFGGVLIVAISIGILFYVAYRISRALEALRRFAEDPKPQHWWQLQGVHTRDELELVGRTFLRFVQKAANLEQRLRRQVRQLKADQLSLEHARAQDTAIIDSMGEGLVVTDEEGKIMLMNKKAEVLLGRKLEETLGQAWLSVVKITDDQGEPVPPEKTLFHAVLQTGKQKSESSFHYTRADGSRFPVAVTATALSYEGETLGVVLVFKDITRAKEIDRLKSEFVSLASHQLRSPLTTIKWYVDLLASGRDGTLKPEQRRDLKRIERGNERMIRLVNHLLNVSRLESGRLAVRPVPTDLSTFLENVVGDIQAQAAEKLCSVILVRDVAQARAAIDPSLLRQVLESLLENSMKYADPERDCRITVRLLADERGHYIVQVQDNGIGVPQPEQDRVFEKFFRAANAAKMDTEGSGLGLYTCKLILETVGCSISFKSQEGKGTIFTITIPKTGMRSKEGEIGLAGLRKP